jgi:YD repeat-containing protein
MWRWLAPGVLLISAIVGCGQEPVPGSDAAVGGLHGPVRSVRSEYFDHQGTAAGKPTGSLLFIYDAKGYLLDEYRYEPDGSEQSHTKYTRKDWQVLKTENTSVLPHENRTYVTKYNDKGNPTGSEAFDGDGKLVEKTQNEPPKETGNTVVLTTNKTKADGTVSVERTEERVDAATGITRQTVTEDGKPKSDWLIQRDKDGNVVSDAIRMPNGSFNESLKRPDGTVLRHWYWAATKTHTWQTVKDGKTLQVIEQSPSDYTKTTYKYDDAERMTEIANWDRAGTLLGKSVWKYQEDNFGNWTEQKEFHWEREMGARAPKLINVCRRVISYY